MLRRSFLFRMPGLSATIGGVTAGTDPTRNMVSSESRIATQVGLDVLLNGGNAVDAAVAIGLVEAVTLPRAGNLGGGGFMLIRMADGRATSIDYRVQAPGRASRKHVPRSIWQADSERVPIYPQSCLHTWHNRRLFIGAWPVWKNVGPLAASLRDVRDVSATFKPSSRCIGSI